MESYSLAADVGGTNLTLALIHIKDKKYKIVFEKKYLTNAYESIIEPVNDFITKCINNYKILVKNAVFAVAGKIDKNKVITPNINMKINLLEIKKKTSLKQIKFINDFTAITYSVEKLKKDQLKELNQGNKIKDKPILIIGAGTGLGKSIYLPKENIVIESEGGHIDFSPNNKQEFDLKQFIKKKIKRNVEIEDIVSGRGIEYIYEFFTKKKLSSQEISKLKRQDKNAKKTFDLFYILYARICKNFALNIICSEIYIGGGIITKNLVFSKKDFMEEFTSNIKYKRYLENIPIKIIKDYESSIIGIGNYIVKNL